VITENYCKSSTARFLDTVYIVHSVTWFFVVSYFCDIMANCGLLTKLRINTSCIEYRWADNFIQNIHPFLITTFYAVGKYNTNITHKTVGSYFTMIAGIISSPVSRIKTREWDDGP